MASTDRVQIPLSFSYPAGTLYASTASGSYTGGTAFDATEPVVSATVNINIRDPNSPGGIIGPATVYQAEGGSTTLSTIQTDAGGNVPGWVEPGSYQINVASIGSFAGATLNWDAVRGDGVTRIASGQIGLTQLTNVNGASLIDTTNIASALVPTGSIFDHAGTAAPAGYHLCDGSVQSQTGVYANLYAVIGSTYNIGGEGGGNFRLPNTQGRFTLGSGSGMGGYTSPGNSGGALAHTHSMPGLSIPALSIPALGVLVGGTLPVSAVAEINPNSFGGAFSVYYTPAYYSGTTTALAVASGSSWSYGATTQTPGVGTAVSGTASGDLGGATSGGATGGGTTGTGTTGTADPAFITFNKIIKL